MMHPGREARAFLRQHLLQLSNALMWALTALPPGAEDLALRALSCFLHGSLMESMYTKATAAEKAFLDGNSTLAGAALRQGAWWQKVGVLVRIAMFPSSHLAKHIASGALPCCHESVSGCKDFDVGWQ